MDMEKKAKKEEKKNGMSERVPGNLSILTDKQQQ